MKKCIDGKNHDFQILHEGGYIFDNSYGANKSTHREYAPTYKEYMGCKKCGKIIKPV